MIMAITWQFLTGMINSFAYMTGVFWSVLDNVILYNNGTYDVTLLDGFIIGGWVFEFVWDIFDEMRP